MNMWLNVPDIYKAHPKLEDPRPLRKDSSALMQLLLAKPAAAEQNPLSAGSGKQQPEIDSEVFGG